MRLNPHKPHRNPRINPKLETTVKAASKVEEAMKQAGYKVLEVGVWAIGFGK